MSLKLICSPCSESPIATVQETLKAKYGQKTHIIYTPLTGDHLIQQIDSLGDDEIWGVWISIYDLADIDHFITTLLGLGFTKRLQRLVVALPQALGNCLVHNQLRSVISHLQRAEFDTIVLECPLLFSEILFNRNILETQRVLLLPTGGSTMAWIHPEEVARQFAYHLLHTQISMSVRLPGRVYLSGKTIAQCLTGLLANQEGAEAWARKRMQSIDTRSDERLDAEELQQFFLQLGWQEQEIYAWIDLILQGSRSIGYETALDRIKDLLPNRWQQKPEPFLYLHLAPKDSLQEWESENEGEDQALQKGIEYWEGNMRFPDSMEDAHSLELLESWLEKQLLQLQVMQVIPGLGILHSQYDLGPTPSSPTQVISLANGVSLRRHFDAADNRLSYQHLEVNWGNGTLPREIAFQEQGRRLFLKEDKLVQFEAEPGWKGWKKALEMMQDHTSVPSWQQKLFRTLGELELEQAEASENPNEELCKCTGLTRAECMECIAQGAQSVEEIAEMTEATRTCGGCYPLIEGMLEGNQLILAEVVEKQMLNEELTQVRIKPLHKEVWGAEAGQHILVQGRMNEEWVTRAYTLTAASSFYEIIVKREKNGKLSSWLSEQADENVLLRITEPQGSFTLNSSKGKVLFFAGGIGITPALAMIRSQAHRKEPRLFHLDWSVKDQSDLVFHKELAYWEGRMNTFSWSYRLSQEEGRITASQVQAQYPFSEGLTAYVCGPEGYVDVVCEGLKMGGWPESEIHRELFTSLPQTGTEGPTASTQEAYEALEVPQHESKPFFPEEEEPLPEKRSEEEEEGVKKKPFFLYPLSPKQAYQEAKDYLELFAKESGRTVSVPSRWGEIEQSFFESGSYAHTYEELEFGARVAWRNSTRCIGRFFWDKLMVRDLRHLTEPQDMFQALVDHLKIATNRGNIMPVISVFAPDKGLRLWNGQLVQYAGYRQQDGSVIGDPANIELTEKIMELGWPGGERSHFDVLPLVIEAAGRAPEWFEIPPEHVMQIPITHPRYDWFESLGLQWYAVPAVANMALDLGGVQYSFVPFSGFYMGTEIGARNFSDPYRYNLLPIVAEKMGLDTSQSHTLWKDSAMLELNIAVLHSYKKHGVRMMDHHTLSEFFLKFDKQETQLQREVHADWTWLVPPISGSSIEIFHIDKWENNVLKPNYYYMEPGWKQMHTATSMDASQAMPEGDIANCPFHQEMARIQS